MQTLDRLKMEYPIGNILQTSNIFSFSRRITYYQKTHMIRKISKKQLLLTVLDVLEAVANDIDLMTSISTEFNNIGQTYQFIEMRIAQVKDKIASIPKQNEDCSCFSLMYTKEQ